MGGWVDAFEETGIPWRFIGILDNVDSTLVIAEEV
jgi:lysozyme family protein